MAHSLTWYPANLLVIHLVFRALLCINILPVLVLMGCSRSVAMAMIVSLFCSQMSDIPEGWSWAVQAGGEALIRIANGRQVLCLLCVSILETIRRIKALSWRDGTEARWASLVGTVSSMLAQCSPPSSSLLLPTPSRPTVSCVCRS